MFKNFANSLLRQLRTIPAERNFSHTGILNTGLFGKEPTSKEDKEALKDAKAAKEGKETPKTAKDKKPAETEDPTQDQNQPKLICVSTDGPITLIGINRPEQRNAINAAAALQLCDAFTAFENDEKSTVAVLYGIGGSFCSGYDILELGEGGERIGTDLLMAAEGSVGPTRRQIKKPVVCGINGYCVANGLELALMCDLRVMEESAILGFFNRRFGVPVIDGGTARLPATIGFSRALDLILTGRSVYSKEALEIGLVNRVVATGTALGQAVNLAFCLSKFPQAALNHDRSSLYSATFESHNFNQAIQNEIMYTSKEVITEMTEGVKKFNSERFKSLKEEGNKEKSMADWEKEEICKEKKTEEICKDKKTEENDEENKTK